MKALIPVLVLATVVLAGCSGLKSYPDTPTRNLDIHTRTDSGSLLSSTRASLDIYHVGEGCSASYEGTVILSRASRPLGLPAGQPSYLVFRFESSSFLAGSSGVTRYDTVFTPLPGRHYDFDVLYIDGIYSVNIRERASARSKAQRIAPVELEDCAGA
jgi:hypothetical protein